MKNKGLFPFLSRIGNDIINRRHNDRHGEQPRPDLDNCRDDTAISERNENDMATERRRVIIAYNNDGTPVYRQVQGSSQEEINQRIVQAYIESGRIYEMLPGLAHSSEAQKGDVLLKEYAEKWLARKRKLKPNTVVRYKKNLKEYILPCLGERALEEITVESLGGTVGVEISGTDSVNGDALCTPLSCECSGKVYDTALCCVVRSTSADLVSYEAVH